MYFDEVSSIMYIFCPKKHEVLNAKCMFANHMSSSLKIVDSNSRHCQYSSDFLSMDQQKKYTLVNLFESYESTGLNRIKKI